MAQSISLTELTQDKYECLRQCADILKRTGHRPVWALSTALRLQSVELPRGLRLPGKFDEQIAVVENANAKYHVKGLRLVTWQAPFDIVPIGAGECTSPACTWAMCASRLSLGELIVLGDSLMRRDGRLKRACREDFVAYLDAAETWAQEHGTRMFPGYRDCRRAIRLMRENTDSSQETRTRLVLMRLGLDCPEPNYAVRVAGGRQLFLDMAYPRFKVCIEYDGGHHAYQWVCDSHRRQLIEDAGWRYVQVTGADLEDPAARAALARRVAERITENAGTICTTEKAGQQHGNKTSLLLRRLAALSRQPPRSHAELTVRQLCDGRRLGRQSF